MALRREGVLYLFFGAVVVVFANDESTSYHTIENGFQTLHPPLQYF
jgi:hypothetical protein